MEFKKSMGQFCMQMYKKVNHPKKLIPFHSFEIARDFHSLDLDLICQVSPGN